MGTAVAMRPVGAPVAGAADGMNVGAAVVMDIVGAAVGGAGVGGAGVGGIAVGGADVGA